MNFVSLTFEIISGTNTTIGGINGLVEDVFALLPQDEIFILFFEKLDSSPKFAAFIQSFRDPTFHRKYSTLWVTFVLAFQLIFVLSNESSLLLLWNDLIEIEGIAHSRRPTQKT